MNYTQLKAVMHMISQCLLKEFRTPILPKSHHPMWISVKFIKDQIKSSSADVFWLVKSSRKAKDYH